MKTRKIEITVPEELRLGQLLYNVMRDNGLESYAKTDTFLDGKYTRIEYRGVDCFYLEDDELLKMITDWIQDNTKTPEGASE